MDDEPPIFETAQEAWEYLAAERREAEDELGDFADEAQPYSETVDQLDAHASAKWLVADFERADTVYGDTPGYDGDHDLGLAYSVTWVEGFECVWCHQWVTDPDDLYCEYRVEGCGACDDGESHPHEREEV